MSKPWAKPLFLAILVACVALSIYVFGLPTTLSMGGGIALIAFGMLWPGLWVASILPPHLFPGIIRPQHSPEYVSSDRPHHRLAPARNEEPVAERLVSQFKDQDYDNWKLVVIANNCTDNTAEVARRAADGDSRIEVIEATFENGVKADALNLVLPDVEGEVVLELDSDNQVPSDLLSKVAKAFSDPEVMAVQTQIRAYNAKGSLLAAFQDLEFLIYSEIWNRGRAALGMGSSIGGTGFAARTFVLKQLNGWTRDLVEDFEMHTRLVMHDIHVTYLPWACVYDEKPVTWDALVKQRKRWIRGHLEIAARRSKGCETLGFIDQVYLYSPLFVFLSMMLLAMGYLSLLFPSLVTGYSYFSPWFWLASLGLMITALCTTVARARDWRLLSLVVPYLMLFTFHWMVVFCSAIMPVSWAQSKTVHGVEVGRGFLKWVGVDGIESIKSFAVVVAIAIAWMVPLMQGLGHAPSPFEAPILIGGRNVINVAVAMGTSAGTVSGVVRPGRSSAPGRLGSGHGSEHREHRQYGDQLHWWLLDGLTAGVRIQNRHLHERSLRTSTPFELPEGASVYVDATLTPSGGSGVIAVPIPY